MNKNNKIKILEYIEDKICYGGFIGGFFVGLIITLCIVFALMPFILALSLNAPWPLWLLVVFTPPIVGIIVWLYEAIW